MAVHNPFQKTNDGTLAMLLPPSELEVMRIMWAAAGPQTVKAVHKQIAATREIAYTTVMTTMVRLAEKGVLARSLTRQGQGGGYVYTVAITEREFVLRAVHQLLDCVVKDFPSVLVQYLDTRREYAAG
jgi:predicted transcriptional regulator